MLALTGQRRDEVGRMAWADLDLGKGLWVVSGEHAKNGKPHTVHLSHQALELLSQTPQTGDLVLSGNARTLFQGYSKAKARLDRISGVSGWTLHDLRRPVVSGMARLGVAPHVTDKILNHQSGTISGAAAVYQRHEFMPERKDALQRWGSHINSISLQSIMPQRLVENPWRVLSVRSKKSC
jgi:integrase